MSDQHTVRLNIEFETIGKLKQALAEANKELEKAKINTVEWSNAFEKVGQLKNQMAQVNTVMRQSATTMQGTQQASSNAAMALLNLNYVIRDSPYFFNNFALGLLAVGNNLNPLIDSFARLRQEAGNKALTTFALLRQALVGGAGISIAFSLVVTAIQSYVFWMSKSKKETEEVKDQTIDLEEKLRLLKGTMEDIAAINTKFTAVKVEELSFVEKQIEAYKNLIARYQEHGASQEAINKANKILEGLLNTQSQLNEEMDAGNKFSAKNVELMKGLADATLKGKDAISQFAKENKLSQGQLDGIIKLWQEYGKEVAAVGGGLAGELPSGMREIALQLGIQDSELQKILKVFEEIRKKVKDIKRELQEAGDASVKIAREMARGMGISYGGEAGNLKEGGAGEGIGTSRPRPSGITTAMGERMKDSMKEFQVQLELAKIASQELGQFLADAFTKGKFALDSFISSLVGAIAQMLILRAITSAFTFGGGNPASVVTAIPAILGLSKISAPQVVVVGGNISMDSNKFVVSLRKVDKSYTANYEVGRGSLLST